MADIDLPETGLHFVSDAKFSRSALVYSALYGGRICIGKVKVNVRQAFAGQAIGIKESADSIWLISFMRYVLRRRNCRLDPVANPVEVRNVLRMSSE